MNKFSGSRTIAPEEIAPWINAPRAIAPKENYPLPPPGKFSPKIVAPSLLNAPQRVLRVNWGKLWLVYEYFK